MAADSQQPDLISGVLDNLGQVEQRLVAGQAGDGAGCVLEILRQVRSGMSHIRDGMHHLSQEHRSLEKMTREEVSNLKTRDLEITNQVLLIDSKSRDDRYKSRSMVGSKIIQYLKPLVGDKSGFRQWHQKFLSAVYSVHNKYGGYLKTMEKEMDLGNKVSDVTDLTRENADDGDEFSEDLHAVLMSKAEGEAYEKLRPIEDQEGVRGYLTLYKWYTETSGLGLTTQAAKLMDPEAPKKEAAPAGVNKVDDVSAAFDELFND